MWNLSRDEALSAIRAYNSGSYRGHRNVDLDRRGYALLAEGVPDNLGALIEAIRFFGEDYGGAQHASFRTDSLRRAVGSPTHSGLRRTSTGHCCVRSSISARPFQTG